MRWNAQTIERIRDAARDGKSRREVMRALGMPEGTLDGIQRKYGLVFHRQTSKSATLASQRKADHESFIGSQVELAEAWRHRIAAEARAEIEAGTAPPYKHMDSWG